MALRAVIKKQGPESRQQSGAAVGWLALLLSKKSVTIYKGGTLGTTHTEFALNYVESTTLDRDHFAIGALDVFSIIFSTRTGQQANQPSAIRVT